MEVVKNPCRNEQEWTIQVIEQHSEYRIIGGKRSWNIFAEWIGENQAGKT